MAQIRTLGEVYDQSISRTSFTLVLLAIAGTMALLLGVFGLYGVLSYTLTRQRREIGIRLALGATRGSVGRVVTLESARLVGAGAGAGLIGAFLSTGPAVARCTALRLPSCRLQGQAPCC